MQRERIHDRARGRWKSILPAVGIDAKFLSNRHGPCPLCGGKDKFRFDDKGGDGTWICNSHGAGNGVDLVMQVKGLDFLGAKREIEAHIGSAPIITPKASRSDVAREEQQRDQMAALWGRARPLDGSDLASRYLVRRGIEMAEWPPYLRSIDELPYWDDTRRTLHPAMLAKFASADGKSAILHRTYLAEPGAKADVAKPRMIMPGKMPVGGAVRLFPAAETMGIAEGLETSMSAKIIFGVPVWAALTSGALMKWKPPAIAKCIFIFGDNDLSLAGQNAGYALGYRLRTEGYQVEMRFPEEPGDWNDVIQSERKAA